MTLREWLSWVLLWLLALLVAEGLAWAVRKLIKRLCNETDSDRFIPKLRKPAQQRSDRQAHNSDHR